MIFRTLDLPAPLGPTTPIFAPGRKFSVTLSRMTLSPWAFLTRCMLYMNSATTTMVVPRESHPDARLGPARGFLKILLHGVPDGLPRESIATACGLTIAPQHHSRTARQIGPDRGRFDFHN